MVSRDPEKKFEHKKENKSIPVPSSLRVLQGLWDKGTQSLNSREQGIFWENNLREQGISLLL